MPHLPGGCKRFADIPRTQTAIGVFVRLRVRERSDWFPQEEEQQREEAAGVQDAATLEDE